MEIDAETSEDSERLLICLAAPTASRALLEAVEDMLDRIAEGRAA